VNEAVVAGTERRRRSTLVYPVVVSRAIVLVAAALGALAGPVPGAARLSLGWLGNLVAASAVRWDAGHYLGLAAHGYDAAGQTVFFPLYPALIRVVGAALGSDVAAGMALSAGAFVIALVLLHRLTELELGRRAADATVLLVAFAPLSFFFTAVYTESLFLALSLGAIYAARRERWAWAAALAALATLTRNEGLLLIIPIAIQWARGSQRRVRQLMWLALVPLALLAFLARLAAYGYGWLAPFDNEAIPEYGRVSTGPIGGVIEALRAAALGVRGTIAGVPPFHPTEGGLFSGGFESIVLLLVLVIAVAALVLTFRKLGPTYGLYATALLAAGISDPVRWQPLASLDRYALTMFPLWMAAGAWLSERRATRTALLFGGAFLAFYSFEFARGAFIA
jgi:hypothetical protein